MIKIFWGGGRGCDTFRIPSLLRTTFAFTQPCFKMFLEDPLMTSLPLPHFKHPSLLLPLPIHHPFPPHENFDQTLMSYFSENEDKNLQNGDVHLAQIADFGMRYLENHLGGLRSVKTFLISFFMLFHLSLTFLRPEFLFKCNYRITRLGSS